MRTKMLLAALVITGPFLAGTAHAAHWTTINFDADLRTMLVDTDQITHNGTRASLWELQVEGRTNPFRGAGFHILLKRDYDCAAGTETITAIKLYKTLHGPAEAPPFPIASFTPSDGSINSIEYAMACKGVAPPAGANVYATIDDAVNMAFADAVKLPADQSNRTKNGFAAMGPPPKKS